MNNKILLIGLLIVFSLFVYGCQSKPPSSSQLSCSEQGYIAPNEANALVNLTNKLVDITNYCFASQNLTSLSYIKYWPDLKENIIIE